jgi:tricorn protease
MQMALESAFRRLALLAMIVPVFATLAAESPPLHRGYYSEPAVHGETIVFTSEGDLWTVDIHGGAARRLTSGSGIEHNATISPDGKTVAFRANYEGPSEVYTMPIDGGLPQRRTWDGVSQPAGWGPDGRLLVATGRESTLPGSRLVLIDDRGERETIPLAQGAQGVYAGDGHTLIFTRWFKQGSYTKRYQGGTAESLWSFNGGSEAVPLTADFAGTSTNPMFWNGRIYFLTDRDGVMNVYSMDPRGHGVRAVSHQRVFDVRSAAQHDGRIVYASGADLWRLDLSTGHEEVIPITLVSDFDQLREHWVKKPLDYITQAHLSPDGSRAVFTARGEIFTLPAAKGGRIVKVAGDSSVRYREAAFLPDGKSIVALSTAGGETEFWKFGADGESAPEQWTHDAKVLRWVGVPSPDGRWLAHHDKDQQLWIYDIRAKQDKRIAQSLNADFGDLSWSPDSHWLAYVETADNLFVQIKVLNLDSGAVQTLTSDRYDSVNPVWSSDGKWLYFLSDRNLQTTIQSPWGPRQPAPHFDRTLRIYELALTPGLRSPFLPADELHPDPADSKEGSKDPQKPDADKDTDAVATAKKASSGKQGTPAQKGDKKSGQEPLPVPVRIDFTDLASRLREVPAPPGNYSDLQATAKRLCWLSASDEVQRKLGLQCLDIANKGDELETVLAEVKSFEISLDRKKLLIYKGDNFYIVDSAVKTAALADPKVLPKAAIDLSHWQISTIPREEYRGIFLDAWRLERDYFYDRNMHGVNWVTMRDRYLPLVDRVANRDELNDLIAQMVGELSALHTFVSGGDDRKPADAIGIATLGAILRRDAKAGGFVVEHVYRHDPDLPNEAPPLARPESRVSEGEIILSIDGRSPLEVADERELLRGKAGQQVMLQVKSSQGAVRSVLARPVDAGTDGGMRYAEWEYTRRLKVDAASQGEIGYVHLRAMGPSDINQWARDYYPVFNRPGLIIDVRNNRGGNIDSWLLNDLLRKAWFYWQPRLGNPNWNMQYAFRGHIVVLCDEATGSDGEAFTEGFKRLQMGKVIGTRTWGGEIWLSSSNTQADNGLASAGETGVYDAQGKWVIEGHGVDPDIVVDNLPHATFGGSDAQLQAAVDLLKQQIKDDPRPVPAHPAYPDKSFKGAP